MNLLNGKVIEYKIQVSRIVYENTQKKVFGDVGTRFCAARRHLLINTGRFRENLLEDEEGLENSNIQLPKLVVLISFTEISAD